MTTAGTRRAPVLITMGDACGIGPELIAQCFDRGAAAGAVVVGDVAVMRRAVRCVRAHCAVAPVQSLTQWQSLPPRVMPVWTPAHLAPGVVEAPLGQVDARAGAAAVACIEEAVRLVMAKEASAVVTAPIHKEALHAAGSPYPGHTEMLQALAHPVGPPPPVRMMLANPELRTVLVSIHVSLREAIDLVRTERVLETIRIAHHAAASWGQPRPRIAVAGLNPHAGEGGLFGQEEVQFIAPAVAAAQAEGLDVSGPFAPDTVFMRARHAPPSHPGAFDLVIAMTHDHGLIPVKYLGVEQGVNVTLGLPFVRTSPDHGTAFDLAGTGRADPSSLLAALDMARRLTVAAV